MTDPAALAHLRHELRTPLNHIIGYAEMLLEDSGSRLARLAPDLRALLDDARQVLATVNERLAPGGKDADSLDLSALGTAVATPLGRVMAATDRLARDATAAGAEDVLSDVKRIAEAARRLAALVIPASATTSGQVIPPDRAGVPGGARAARGGILVVDDDGGNRDLLVRRLTREGYEVQAAPDGEAALAALAGRAGRVDLMLLDVMMPGLDGYEVLRRMKADPTLRDIPVLMISALDEVQSVVRCIELGAEDYLPKPFDPVLLRARIGACLEKKRLRDQEVRHLGELAEWNRTLEQRVSEQVGELEQLGRLKRFFSPQLAELIVAGGAADPLKTHRREITVVFLDLRGFTAFAETAEPEEVMGVLREYHAEMGRLVLEHEGTLERFTGDGMMVFFNDPVEVPDPAERALRMALAMRDGVARLGIGWRKRGWDLALGVGVAKGYATIGAIGFEGRWDYGAIGTVTNLAARLCGEARPGQILISAGLAADAESLVDAEDIGALALKGLARPIPVWSVRGLRTPGRETA
jgi:class 3 adenylate cyclase/CheY-like chemotaxis protein